MQMPELSKQPTRTESNGSTEPVAATVAGPGKPEKGASTNKSWMSRSWWWYPVIGYLVYRSNALQDEASRAKLELQLQKDQSKIVSQWSQLYPSLYRNGRSNYGAGLHSPVTPFNAPAPSTAAVQNLGPATVGYWNAAVFQRLQSEGQFSQSLERAFANGASVAVSNFVSEIDRMANELRRIQDVNTAGVDAELVSMVQKHLGQDTELAETLRTMTDLIVKSGRNEITADQFLHGMNILANKVDVDPASRPLVERLQKLCAEQEAQVSEIDVMRGKLGERYKGQSFPLPDDSNINSAK